MNIAQYFDTQSKIYSVLSKSRLTELARIVHSFIIKLELLLLNTNFRKQNDFDFSELTVIVKTFNRPNELKRLLVSIEKYYPTLNIIVANDGHRIYQSELPRNVTLLNLSYDSGVSFGRNAALSLVKTPYFLSLDDDFIFYRHTNLCQCFNDIRENSDIDLIGGRVVNLPFFRISESGGIIYTNSKSSSISSMKYIGEFEICDKVPQFFIARTDKIKQIGWDQDIKRLDHGVFFTRLKGKVTSVFNPNFSVLHARTPFNMEYLKYRLDYSNDVAIISERYFQAS